MAKVQAKENHSTEIAFHVEKVAKIEANANRLTEVFLEEIGYRFHQGKNHLTLTVRWPQARS